MGGPESNSISFRHFPSEKQQVFPGVQPGKSTDSGGTYENRAYQEAKENQHLFHRSRRLCGNLHLQHRLQKATVGICRQISRRMPSTGRWRKRLQNLCRQKRPFWYPLDGTLQWKETASCQRAGEEEHTELEEDGKMKFLSCKSNMPGNRVFAVTYSSTNKGVRKIQYM